MFLRNLKSGDFFRFSASRKTKNGKYLYVVEKDYFEGDATVRIKCLACFNRYDNQWHLSYGYSELRSANSFVFPVEVQLTVKELVEHA